MTARIDAAKVNGDDWTDGYAAGQKFVEATR